VYSFWIPLTVHCHRVSDKGADCITDRFSLLVPITGNDSVSGAQRKVNGGRGRGGGTESANISKTET